jgi:hypothetical protein
VCCSTAPYRTGPTGYLWHQWIEDGTILTVFYITGFDGIAHTAAAGCNSDGDNPFVS